ncbi:MAG: DUF6402 family protein [Burkholderiales bacterium]|nr:DUF6402 family protein [Burkholderiales bacterium]
MTSGDEQSHESDVKPSPTTGRRGLDRAWVYSHYRSQGFEEVFNATFRRWRDTTGRGGDFLVYSDVEWIAPTVREIAQ